MGEKFPGLIKCMSTNGLLLYERADEVIRAGVDSLTVTVNAEIEAMLNKFIMYHGRTYEGVEGAEILIVLRRFFYGGKRETFKSGKTCIYGG